MNTLGTSANIIKKIVGILVGLGLAVYFLRSGASIVAIVLLLLVILWLALELAVSVHIRRRGRVS